MTATGPDANQDESPKLIYMVDDEPMLLDLAETILSPLGFRVEGFRTGETALQAYVQASTKPWLLITDYAMGTPNVMNGLELIEQCRNLNPDQRTLLLSGTVDQTVYENSPCKPDRFLAKPYRPAQLISLVQRAVNEVRSGHK